MKAAKKTASSSLKKSRQQFEAASFRKTAQHSSGILKALTGIQGLDEITGGGLPSGRPTLICGSAGCGKTLFAMEFLVAGATKFNEPGVFMAFEETEKDLTENVTSLGVDLDDLVAKKKIALEHVYLERSEIQETGEYDLEGLFIRLGHAIESIGAKRVVLDTIEVLFAGLKDDGVIRSEIRRLFRWLKEKGVTAIITGERGKGSLTRHGLEEYVSDCVILLDHRVDDQLSTRRLRVVKYRGSEHGTNEYPFLIDSDGISVLPISSLGLDYPASTKRIASGVPELDVMLSNKGYFRGSSILISGTAGTGKSSLAAQFVNHSCENGERCLYISFEESPGQFKRNMSSIGIHLQPHIDTGTLNIVASRPSVFGLERHLVELQKMIVTQKPTVIVLDPLTSLIPQGNQLEVLSILTRIIDLLKTNQVTSLFTSLVRGDYGLDSSEAWVSSLIDTWVILRELESEEERTRGLYILKSRGMPHSKQVREFKLGKDGIKLLDFKSSAKNPSKERVF
jgi:circadian clock protein KaiC